MTTNGTTNNNDF